MLETPSTPSLALLCPPYGSLFSTFPLPPPLLLFKVGRSSPLSTEGLKKGLGTLAPPFGSLRLHFGPPFGWKPFQGFLKLHTSLLR